MEPSDPPYTDLDNDSLALPSTTASILEQNSRFRLLVLGKAGVGKSTLINKAFGLNDDSMTSHDKTGVCDINHGIEPPSNDYLVVHDSQGFDAGERENLQLLKKFISERTTTTDPSQGLHCIWLCIQTPFGGGRVLETGTEEVLKVLAASERPVPLVIIFTKYDQLVLSKRGALMRSRRQRGAGFDYKLEAQRQSDDEMDNKITPVIRSQLDQLKLNAEVIVVSDKKGFGQKLEKLIDQTIVAIKNVNPGSSHPLASLSSMVVSRASTDVASSVTLYPAESEEETLNSPQILVGIAQRVNPGVTVDTIIEIGRRRYWRGLASSAHFPGISMKKCFHVLHVDIVKPFNFPELENNFLLGPDFRVMIADIVDKQDEKTKRNIAQVKSLTAAAGSIAGIAGAATAAAVTSGPAAVAVGPAVFAALVFAKWVYDTYRETPETLRRMMMYIIHLTNVLVVKIYLDKSKTASPNSSTSSVGPSQYEQTKEAIKEYLDSKILDDVRDRVDIFIRSGQWKIGDRDLALQKLGETIKHGFERLTEHYECRIDSAP